MISFFKALYVKYVNIKEASITMKDLQSFTNSKAKGLILWIKYDQRPEP